MQIRDRIMDEVEAANYLGVAPGVLRAWRVSKHPNAPEFHPMCDSGAVFYFLSDLNAYKLGVG